ncbi:hypothetical protein C8R43DRAFT_1116452 [Mycena crocata]|nr:hypothetical protein C8R43DRAFT_1116452 [Mycena crocata]
MAIQHFSEFIFAVVSSFGVLQSRRGLMQSSGAFAKFRPGTTCKAKEEAYRTVYLLLAAALALPGIKGFKVALTVEFCDLKAFKDYIPHPHHLL